jgi:hypothetical protein
VCAEAAECLRERGGSPSHPGFPFYPACMNMGHCAIIDTRPEKTGNSSRF